MTARRQIYRWLPGFCLFLQITCAYGANTLTVLNFQNRVPGDGYDWMQRAFPDMLLKHFVQNGQYTVLEREQMQVLLDELSLSQSGVTEKNDAEKFASVAKVQKVVFGHYGVDRNRLSVTAFIFDAETKVVDTVATAFGDVNSLCDIDHQVFANLLSRLGKPLTKDDQEQLMCVVSSSLRAAAAFYAGQGEFDAGNYPEALVQFQRAGKLDPQYGEAQLWAAQMYSYLGEYQHGVVELHQFINKVPQHPLVAHARMKCGLILKDDLKCPRYAIGEFEKLVAMAPEVCVPPAELRQAHYQEYATLIPGMWKYSAYRRSNDYFLAAAQVAPLGKDRAKKFDCYVYGWYQLGQAYAAGGDLTNAFCAYDQGRAVCRWLFLEQQEDLSHRLYKATAETYRQIASTNTICLPSPDWAMSITNDQTFPVFGEQQTELFRYGRGIGGSGDEEIILQAPEGKEFASITFSGLSVDQKVPSYTVENLFGPEPTSQVIASNRNYRTVKFGCSNRAIRLLAHWPTTPVEKNIYLTVAHPDYQHTTIYAAVAYQPWKNRKLRYVSSGKAYVGIHFDSPSINIVIDGVPQKVPLIGCGSPSYMLPNTYLSPGVHQIVGINSNQTNSVTIAVEDDQSYDLGLPADTPWRDVGIRLPNGNHPDICRTHHGNYWLAYVAGDPSTNEGAHLWMMKSADLLHWSQPMYLSINSPQADIAPRLLSLPDGRVVLLFLSDRRQSGIMGIYCTQTTDGQFWSPPHLIASYDKQWNPDYTPQVAEDSTGLYWLVYPLYPPVYQPLRYSSEDESIGNKPPQKHQIMTSVTQRLALRNSTDGIHWGTPILPPWAAMVTTNKMPLKGGGWYGDRCPKLYADPIHGLVAAASYLGNGGTGLLIFTSPKGQDWQLQSPIQFKDTKHNGCFDENLDSVRDSILMGKARMHYPRPKLYYGGGQGVDWSSMIELPDGKYAIVAGQNTMIVYTASKDDLLPYLKEVCPNSTANFSNR